MRVIVTQPPWRNLPAWLPVLPLVPLVPMVPVVFVALLLTACASLRPSVHPPVSAPAPASAPTAPVPALPETPATSTAPALPATPATTDAVPETAAPSLTRVAWEELPGWRDDDLAQALPALRQSCRVLVTQAPWQRACASLPADGDGAAARRYFESRFAPYRMANADGTLDGLATGYYEPVLRGSRTPSARYRVPVYGLPADPAHLALTREQIEGAEAPLKGQEIAWVDDEVELFFLQVQGSGRIRLDDGSVMRIGFAAHNGQTYRSIGRVLIERGELTLETASMQGIRAWAADHPARLRELLNQNPRYVFFRELDGPDTPPPGALGVPLTPRRSVAVDARYVPLGAPLFVATTWPNTDKPLQQLVLAQDTGGAIRGAVRVDYFWGTGEDAAREAGRMQQSLRAWVLLPVEQAEKR